jgi:regulator of protease activity HflC (stomatin/prohibitin superfamily)
VEGSKYNAKDFIHGEGRERFERVFFADLQKVCADKGVEILRGMVRKIQVPEEISKPIRDAEIANQELLRNQQEKLRADGAAEKMEAETKINQRKQQIEPKPRRKSLRPRPSSAWQWQRSPCRLPRKRPRPPSPSAKRKRM